jgi:hypothetical protein
VSFKKFIRQFSSVSVIRKSALRIMLEFCLSLFNFMAAIVSHDLYQVVPSKNIEMQVCIRFRKETSYYSIQHANN